MYLRLSGQTLNLSKGKSTHSIGTLQINQLRHFLASFTSSTAVSNQIQVISTGIPLLRALFGQPIWSALEPHLYQKPQPFIPNP
jgi:hypothetical protein